MVRSIRLRATELLGQTRPYVPQLFLVRFVVRDDVLVAVTSIYSQLVVIWGIRVLARHGPARE